MVQASKLSSKLSYGSDLLHVWIGYAFFWLSACAGQGLCGWGTLCLTREGRVFS